MPEVVNVPALLIVLRKPILFKINCEHCTFAKKKKKINLGSSGCQCMCECLTFVCVCVPTACLATCVLRVSMYALVCVSSEGKFLSQGWGFFLS